MKKIINVGIVGTRFMAKAHSNAYLQVSRFFNLPVTPVLHTACGRNPEHLKGLVDQFGWKKGVYSFQELIEDDEIDLIDICTPNDLHMSIAVGAARAGKHILCEKPMARHLKEAEAMYLAVNETGVINMIVSNYRFIPAIVLAKKMIDEGKIGTIRHFNAVYFQDWLVDPDFPFVWRNDAVISGSGAHGDMNAHTVDLARYLVGEFESVNGFQETFIKNRSLPNGQGVAAVSADDATLFFSRFQNGALGSFMVSRVATGKKNFFRLEIFGSKGSLAFNLERLNELEYFSLQDDPQSQGNRNIIVTDPTHPYMDVWWPPGHVLGWEHAFIHQVKELMEGIAADKPVSPDFLDGLTCQKVLDAVVLSAKTGSWIKIQTT